ncbi:hypothetical protein SAMN05421780_101113 [Flexibacter flexilis DSM 6793]|uniref:Beta-lactamase-inhibitor-like, PepSY-like n=1 Tax=Flexibacter flexilis DSM 6793 TaxID=927664 RepID=A0A1I1DC89_9BACT|nr:hypothetical protein [Flexibacter flexilis]SFB72447.1 hypothetical protein SAMN05421780_101113 [Flexibacter flexilis DSM 6793]
MKILTFLVLSFVFFHNLQANNIEAFSSNKNLILSYQNYPDSSSLDNRFDLYISLLFKYDIQVDSILGEESVKGYDKYDEFFDYRKNKIRVWLDRGAVYKILTKDKTVDFLGTHIGNNVQSFRKVFGKSRREEKGAVHFNFDGTYIVVKYNPKTKITLGVFIMNEDYEK